MKRLLLSLSILLLSLALFLPTVFAEHIFGPDELDTNYGAYFRIRQETWDNVFDFQNGDHKDDNFFRLKTSLWTKLDYNKQYIFFVKLTNEARYFMNSSNPDSRPFGLNEDELVFDNLYVEAKSPFGLPVDLKIGRQDFLFTYGEGFLIMDGTPMDGSRTFYFNAVKANVRVNDNFNFDLVYLSDPQRDTYLPSLYAAEKKLLNASDEEGFIAYGRLKAMDGLQVEPYYIYKREKTDTGPDSKLDLNAVGVHLVYAYDSWKFGGEYAHQWGDYDSGRDRRGDGGYVYVKKAFKDVMWHPGVELRYVYLSGDDPDTDKNEAWDPMFSRWPWMSELFILTLAPETGIPAYWTNLQMYRVAVKASFTKNTGMSVAYNYLRANEDPSTHFGTPNNAPIYTRNSKSRGSLFQGKISHKFTRKIDGYLLIEHFRPGDFYTYDDSATFVRWQLQVKI